MKRLIYAFDSADTARAAVAMLRERGIPEKCISLIARHDIQLETIPDRYLDARTDFMPALARGGAIGGITGLFAGIVAMAFPPLGIAIAGPALIGFVAGGAALGAWMSSMVGASVPDTVRQKFEDEIRAGRTLLVVDANGNEPLVTAAMATGTDRHLLWQSDVASPPAL